MPWRHGMSWSTATSPRGRRRTPTRRTSAAETDRPLHSQTTLHHRFGRRGVARAAQRPMVYLTIEPEPTWSADGPSSHLLRSRGRWRVTRRQDAGTDPMDTRIVNAHNATCSNEWLRPLESSSRVATKVGAAPQSALPKTHHDPRWLCSRSLNPIRGACVKQNRLAARRSKPSKG